MKKFSLWIVSLLSGVIIITAASPLFAADIVPVGGSAVNAYADPAQPINTLYDKIYTVITYVAGALALIFITYNGIQYISSGGDAGKAKTARANIINTIIGIAIIGAAYFIIRLAETIGNTVFNRVV